MKKLNELSRKYPIAYAILGFIVLIGSLKFLPKIQAGALTAPLHELFVAIVIFIVYTLFEGIDASKPKKENIMMTMKHFRVYLIILAAISVPTTVVRFIKFGGFTKDNVMDLIGILLLGTVGIVEEFTMRGMVFNGILLKTGKTTKGIFTAAAVSGFLFGFIHVISAIFTGQITDILGWLQALAKTLSAGVMGFCLAISFLESGNIWSVVIFHSINDMLDFLADAFEEGSTEIGTYVFEDSNTAVIVTITGIIFTIIWIPYMVKCIKRVKANYPNETQQTESC